MVLKEKEEEVEEKEVSGVGAGGEHCLLLCFSIG
jgi:hypothetical protein